MAKALKNVVGIDLGRYALKSVLLQRRGEKQVAITHFGSHIPAQPARTAEELSQQLKSLIKDMGGSTKQCVVSVSSPEALVRIVEQPETPVQLLREAIRLNGMMLLNQDVKSYVLDCDLIEGQATPPEEGNRRKYLVGGLPRTEVDQVAAAMQGASLGLHAVQLAPVCVFNAFEQAHPEIFNQQAFFLVDIGHAGSTLMVGSKRELILVRSVEFGGGALMEALIGLSGEGPSAVVEALEQEDEVMVEYTRVSIAHLAREIGSSIGFFEAQHEQTIPCVYVSGGPAKSATFLKLLSEELSLKCERWSAAGNFENAIEVARREDFEREKADLNVALGAAAEALTLN